MVFLRNPLCPVIRVGWGRFHILVRDEPFKIISLSLISSSLTSPSLSCQKIPSYEEVLAEVVNFCCTLLEKNFYILGREKHMLLKAIGFSLFLMDHNSNSIYKMDSKKKISLQRVDKLFKVGGSVLSFLCGAL